MAPGSLVSNVSPEYYSPALPRYRYVRGPPPHPSPEHEQHYRVSDAQVPYFL